MSHIIDCLFIGHNEMSFQEYERQIRKMDLNSGAYRDLNMNFIRYDNKPYSITEILNIFFRKSSGSKTGIKPFYVSENFSAAISYLGSYLNRRGLTFDFVNSFQEEKSELAEKLQRDNIRVIAIITTLYVSVFPILEIIAFIKRYNQKAKIIIGGPYVSTQFRNQEHASLKYLLGTTIGADIYVNSSQGEAALVKIIESLKHNRSLDQVNNLYYKKDESYIQTPQERETNKLEENMVNWDLFSDRVGEFVNVRTSISCPFSCAFCGFPEHAGKYQAAGVEAIEGELKALSNIKSLKCVHFIDDTFNVPAQRFKSILRIMIKNDFKFHWHSYFRCQYADREIVELMKESGCEGVFLGIESGNDQILKNMNKAVNTKKYLMGIELLKKYGITTFGNFIIGFPGETPGTVQDTVEFIEQSQLDFYRVQLWYAESITPIYRQREKYKIQGENFEWSHSTMNAKEASDFVEEIFLTPRQAIWIPQYNFDFDNIWHLIHRGMNIEKVKDFLKAFNNGVREKLRNPFLKEVGYDISRQLMNIFNPGNTSNDDRNLADKSYNLDDSEAEFDF